MRDILTAIAAMFAIALIALMVAPFVIDWDAQRGRLTEILREELGIEARIAGGLRVALLPTPELDASEVEFGPADKPFARAERLTITLSPMALLSGRVAITGARVDHPEIARPALAQLDAPAPLDRARLERVGLERLTLRGLRLVDQIGPGSRATSRGAPHDVQIEAPSLLGPFRIDIADPGLGREVHAQIGKLEDGRARMKGLIEDRSLAMRASLDGLVSLPGVPGRPIFEGNVTLNGNPSLGDEPGLQAAVQGSMRVVADLDRWVLDPIALSVGEGERALQVSGRGEARFGGARPELRLALGAKRLDLSPIPAGLAPRERPTDFRALLSALAARQPGAAPFDLTLEAEIGAVPVSGATLQEVTFSGGITAGAPRLERLSLRLPGATQARFQRATDAGAGAVDGELEITSEELGTLVAWARGVERAPGFPAQARLVARLAGGAGGVAIPMISLESPAGALHGTGQFQPAAAGLRAEPRLTLDLAARRFEARVLAALDPLKPILGLELASRLVVERLVLDQVEMGGLRVAIQRTGDTVRLSEFRLTGRAGETVTLSGSSSPDTTHLTGKLDAERLADIARLAGALLPGPETEAFARRAGLLEPAIAVANIRITQEGGTNRWDVALEGKFGGSTINAEARSANVAGQLSLAGDITLAAPDGGRLVSQIGGRAIASRGSGPGKIRLKAEGDPRRAVSGSLSVDIAGLEIVAEGDFNPFRARPLEGTLVAEAADLGRIAAALGTDWPRAPIDVPTRLAGRLFSTASKITITDLEAELGPDVAQGEMSFDFARGGEVAGRLKLDRLDLATLFEPVFGVAGEAGGGWSERAFGPALAPALSGDLWIESRTGRIGPAVTLDAPQFVFRFAPGLIGVEGFEARQGEARIAGTLTAQRKGERVELGGRLDLARLPFPFLGGRLSGTLPFSGGGASPRELVSSLAGAGVLELDRFFVPNADPGALPRITRRDIDELTPIDENRIGALVEGELRKAAFESPAASWNANLVNGVLRIGGRPLAAGALGAPGIEVNPAILVDFARLEAEARLTFRQLALPKDWRGAVPEIALQVTQRLGASDQPRRQLNVASFVNGLLALAIQRDLERAEAFEADIRERAMHLRRQKADAWRERREREIAEVEAILEEDQRQIRLRGGAQAEFERQRHLRESAEREAREKAERDAAERLARQKADEDAAARLKAEEAAARMKAEEERLRVKAEEERLRLDQLAREAAQRATPPPAPASGAPLPITPLPISPLPVTPLPIAPLPLAPPPASAPPPG